MPEMVYVVSTSIEAVGYDRAAWELYLRFRSGRTYCYRNVPMEVYEELMVADSKGTYVNTVIKPNYPDYSRV